MFSRFTKGIGDTVTMIEMPVETTTVFGDL